MQVVLKVFYSADDAEGYNVYLSYNEDSDSMSGSV